MDDSQVAAYCIETIHAVLMKRLGRDKARNRAGAGGSDADKIARMFGNTPESLAREENGPDDAEARMILELHRAP